MAHIFSFHRCLAPLFYDRSASGISFSAILDLFGLGLVSRTRTTGLLQRAMARLGSYPGFEFSHYFFPFFFFFFLALAPGV